MILLAAERAKFATYLEETAHDNEMIAKQMEERGLGQLAQKYRVEAKAALIIAKILRQTEDA